MGATVRYVTPELVREFRIRHKVGTQSDLADGFAVQTRAVRHWEAEGGPLYVGLLLAYAEKYGYNFMAQIGRQVAKGKLPPFDRDAITAFLFKHEITQTEFTRLLGFTSEKASTNWKNAGNAPSYVQILVAAIDECGIDLLRAMNGGKDFAGMKSLIEAKSIKPVVDALGLPDTPVKKVVPPAEKRVQSLENPSIAKALQFMSARDRDILVSRKFSAKPVTLEALGDKYGLTRQRVQQIEALSMKKLADAAE